MMAGKDFEILGQDLGTLTQTDDSKSHSFDFENQSLDIFLTYDYIFKFERHIENLKYRTIISVSYRRIRRRLNTVL